MSEITVGSGVMLKGKDNLKYIYVSEKKEAFNRKFDFDCRCLIGKKYGSAYRILNRGDLEAIDAVAVEQVGDDILGENTEEDQKKDNRNIEDHKQLTAEHNQKLSKEDIQSMEKDGISGSEIIQELVENSSTFNERTEYSKAKYVQKKKKKYVPQFLVLKPSARLLAEMYFFKNPGKILEIRPDTLAQMLVRSNVQADSNVLVFENCQGLVCGGVLERLGDGGKLIQLYTSSFPVRIIMEQFNFSEMQMDKNVCSLSIDKITMLKKMFELGKSDDEIIEIMLGKTALEFNDKEEQNPDLQVVDEKPIDEKPVDENPDGAGKKRKFDKRKGKGNRQQYDNDRVAFISKKRRADECRSALSLLRSQKVDSLIIASKYHPKNVLLSLLAYLPSSSPFVVYFPYKEPLMECCVILRELKLAACLEVTKSWYRNIQVLPNRTHPQNMMSGSSGYLLHGVKIEP